MGSLRISLLMAMLSLSSGVSAQPFSDGNVAKGKALVEANCVSCHAKQFGEDGSGIYMRDNRKVKNAQALLTQIRFCQTMLNLSWFEDDELNVASYLNKQYYKFDN